MNTAVVFGFLVILAYVLGSIPFGKIIGKKYGVDIQKLGTGNIGFANVRRELGWTAGLIVLAGDILKGFLPVLIAQQYLPINMVLVVAVAAVLGHVFPVWLKFNGGKGIATGLGVTLAINPVLGLSGGVIYLLGLIIYKKSAPSSVTASWFLPLGCFLFLHQYAYFYLGLAAFATWTHRDNIQKLKIFSKA